MTYCPECGKEEPVFETEGGGYNPVVYVCEECETAFKVGGVELSDYAEKVLNP